MVKQRSIVGKKLREDSVFQNVDVAFSFASTTDATTSIVFKTLGDIAYAYIFI